VRALNQCLLETRPHTFRFYLKNVPSCASTSPARKGLVRIMQAGQNPAPWPRHFPHRGTSFSASEDSHSRREKLAPGPGPGSRSSKIPAGPPPGFSVCGGGAATALGTSKSPHRNTAPTKVDQWTIEAGLPSWAITHEHDTFLYHNTKTRSTSRGIQSAFMNQRVEQPGTHNYAAAAIPK